MKSTQPQIVKHTKSCFLKHAETWLSPKTVALSCHSENSPVQIEDVSKISTPSMDTKRLLWSNCLLPAFFDITSQCSPCLSLAQPKDWKAFKNNQMANERLIGNITQCLKQRKVKDSQDTMADEQMKKIDNKIRAYITTMATELKVLKEKLNLIKYSLEVLYSTVYSFFVL